VRPQIKFEYETYYNISTENNVDQVKTMNFGLCLLNLNVSMRSRNFDFNLLSVYITTVPVAFPI